MTAPEPALSSASRKARIVRAYLRRACWYSSRAEIEPLHTVSGFLGGLRTLVTG